MSAGSTRSHKALGGGERGPCRRKKPATACSSCVHYTTPPWRGEDGRGRPGEDLPGQSSPRGISPRRPRPSASHLGRCTRSGSCSGRLRRRPRAAGSFAGSLVRPSHSLELSTGDEHPDRHVRLSLSAPLHRPHRVANGPHTPARGRIGALRLHTNAGRWRRALAPHLGELVWGERRGRGVWDASCALPGTPRLGTDLKRAIFERTHRSPAACAKNRFVSRRSPTQIIDRRSAVG